ncbi:MAG: amino acid permease [Planctomycetota bacterium]
MNPARRELSAFDIGCVVVGGIIGVGIFFTPQKVAAKVDAEWQVMLAWGLGGVLAVLGAIVFAELSQLVPGHGGTFRYLERAFGRTTAFLYGFANWLVIQSGAAGIVGLILCNYLEIVVAPAAPWSETAKVLGSAAAILVFTAINVVGLRTGKRVQNALTVTKVLALVFLIALAFCKPAVAGAPAEPPPPSGQSLVAMLAAAMLPVLFATGGWQQGSFVAGAARHPRSVPLGILGGVAVVVVVYMSVNLAYLGLLGFDKARTSNAIGAAAAEVVLGPVGGRVLAAMVVVSAAGILNTICLAPPYVLLAMAEQGCMPAAFARLHPRWQTPVVGVLGQGLWSVLLLLGVHVGASLASSAATQDTLGFVCDSVVYADWLFYMLCGAAVLVLRRRGVSRGGALGSTAAFGFTLGAALVMVGAIYAMPAASLLGTGVIVLGWFARRWLGSAVKI